MSRELDLLAREFAKVPVMVMRTEINLYQTNIRSATAVFLKDIENNCKKRKQSKITLIAAVEIE